MSMKVYIRTHICYSAQAAYRWAAHATTDAGAAVCRCPLSLPAACCGMAAPGESTVLEEEIDENYEPTQAEIDEYAKWLGMVRRPRVAALLPSRQHRLIRTGCFVAGLGERQRAFMGCARGPQSSAPARLEAVQVA